MMRALQNIRSSCRSLFRTAAIACLVLFLALSPAPAFAQCEGPGAAVAAAGEITANDNLSITVETVNNLTAPSQFWPFDLNIMRMALGMQDQQNWQQMFAGSLNPWWTQWLGGLKAMTEQLAAATSYETEELGMINDASNAFLAAQGEQKERIKATLKFQPTDQACRFDSDANYLAQDRAIDEAVQNGFEWDFENLASNENGSIAEYGDRELQSQRWDIYTKNFCDYTAEDCDSGCSPPPEQRSMCPEPSQKPPYPNMDIYVSKMLFKNETLPVEDKTTWQAMQSMMFNVTGYKVPDPILVGSIGSDAEQEEVFTRRQYMAQMSAVGSLLYSVVGDRIEGVNAPEPRQIRAMMGIASPTPNPSMREIRQSVIEQLWDPNFYKNLGDNPNTISQKELYLKAYGLTMLYDMIGKQEKISTAYAIETANLLKQSINVSGNFSGESPNKQVAP